MSSLDTYFSAIDQRLGDVSPDEIDIPAALLKVASPDKVKLEDSLLIALLSVWEESETRPFFTTTKIAEITRQVFPSAPPKHKDNVSRYFNQDFYAYYEIELADDQKTRRYRLSNTGYGMAVRSLRKLTRSETGDIAA